MASAQVCSLPTASTATWLPPPVSSATAAGMSEPSASSTCSAPRSAATASASGFRSTATTRPPSARAIITVLSPTPPAPTTVTHSPSVRRARPTRARYAVANRHPRLAAVAKSIDSGMATRLVSAACSATYSAKDPQWVKPGCCWSGHTWAFPARHHSHRPHPQTNGTVTRSPTVHRPTPSPTSTTTPASS